MILFKKSDKCSLFRTIISNDHSLWKISLRFVKKIVLSEIEILRHTWVRHHFIKLKCLWKRGCFILHSHLLHYTCFTCAHKSSGQNFLKNVLAITKFLIYLMTKIKSRQILNFTQFPKTCNCFSKLWTSMFENCISDLSVNDNELIYLWVWL